MGAGPDRAGQEPIGGRRGEPLLDRSRRGSEESSEDQGGQKGQAAPVGTGVGAGVGVGVVAAQVTQNTLCFAPVWSAVSL